MIKKTAYYWLILVFFMCCYQSEIYGQSRDKKNGSDRIIDSLDNRLNELQSKIPGLHEKRNLEYFNVKREFDHTLFIKTYETYIKNEELYKAKSLVEEKLERAEFRSDGLSRDFYLEYKKRIYNQIKQQKIYYQHLFEKEKTFKKHLNTYIKKGTIESYERALRMIDLSIKYARENQLIETEKYLEKYRNHVNALIMDWHSPFDLEKLSANPAAFEKTFNELVNADSLEQIKTAEELIEQCYAYNLKMGNTIDTLYYYKKKLTVASSVSDYNDRIGKQDLQQITDQAVIARLDSLNPRGVYKWHEFIVIINEFNPKYGSYNLKKGEAIMESDKMLFNYIRKQEIAKIKRDYKIHGTRFIPYKDGSKMEEFIFNNDTKCWQYMICYEMIENTYFTGEIRKYMPPIVFSQEEYQ
jgi:hypothetical protein